MLASLAMLTCRHRLRAHLFTTRNLVERLYSLKAIDSDIHSEPHLHYHQFLCAATDVGMHGLLASQSCYHSVLPLVCVHCGPVEDFFITKQTSLHPFDFVRNLFHLLVCILFS